MRVVDTSNVAAGSSPERVTWTAASGLLGWDHTRPIEDVRLAPTLQFVHDAVSASEGTVSASDVAAVVGIGRATAQRYLTQLEQSGRVVLCRASSANLTAASSAARLGRWLRRSSL